jgi:quinol-cytochrome oxidoreductase complex cytochrome b subunit
VFLHIWALHVVGSEQSGGHPAAQREGPQDTVPFHPYYTVKDGIAITLVYLDHLLLLFVFFMPERARPPGQLHRRPIRW